MKSIKLLFKQKWIPFLSAYLGKFFLKLLAFTCRFKIKGLEEYLQLTSQKKCILVLWHNRLSLVAEILLKSTPHLFYTAVVSKSRDGKIIDTLANSYKQGKAIQVPHNAKSQALITIINRLKYGKEILIITPDGPRGPSQEVKPGVIVAAQASSAAIIPFTWNAKRFWKLSTWDQFILPKPFTTITASFGSPFFPSSDEQKPLSEQTAALKQALCALDENSA